MYELQGQINADTRKEAELNNKIRALRTQTEDTRKRLEKSRIFSMDPQYKTYVKNTRAAKKVVIDNSLQSRFKSQPGLTF